LDEPLARTPHLAHIAVQISIARLDVSESWKRFAVDFLILDWQIGRLWRHV